MKDQGNIGNYKGVMLCNRPNQKLIRKDKPTPFISRVDSKEPVGVTKPHRLHPRLPQSKPKQILSRHKNWLRQVKQHRAEALLQQEQAQQLKALKTMKFTEKTREQRQVMKEQTNPLDKAKVLMKAEETVLVDANIRNLIENYDKDTKKPKWAMTASEVAEVEEREVDDLLCFFEGLNYDQYVQDLEMKLAINVLQRKVKKKVLKGLGTENRQLKLETPPGGAERRQDTPAQHTEEWQDYGRKQYEVLAKAIADQILRENPALKQVHSNASIRKLMQKHIKSTIAKHPNLAILREKVPSPTHD